MSTMEPACWAWPVPPERIADEEVSRDLANQAGQPAETAFGPAALRLLYADVGLVRFREFHSGGRGLANLDGVTARCAICGLRQSNVIVDHAHMTGLVRGLLCRSCNTREGNSEGEVFTLYRARNPASMLGYRAYYVGRGWPAGWWDDLPSAVRLTGDPDWRPR